MQVNVERRHKFQTLRKKYKVSQRSISLDLGVSEAQIRVIESGRGNPSAELMFKLAKYFATSPEDLFPDLASMAEREVVSRRQ